MCSCLVKRCRYMYMYNITCTDSTTNITSLSCPTFQRWSWLQRWWRHHEIEPWPESSGSQETWGCDSATSWCPAGRCQGTCQSWSPPQRRGHWGPGPDPGALCRQQRIGKTRDKTPTHVYTCIHVYNYMYMLHAWKIRYAVPKERRRKPCWWKLHTHVRTSMLKEELRGEGIRTTMLCHVSAQRRENIDKTRVRPTCTYMMYGMYIRKCMGKQGNRAKYM